MSRYNSDAIDACCEEMLGHTNWSYADSIPNEMQRNKKENDVNCIVVFFKEPLEEEDE
jgi:hypothetical protein